MDIDTSSTDSYTFLNATSTASLLPQATSGIGQLSTAYANDTLNGGNTVTVPSTIYSSSCRPSTDSRGQVFTTCDYEDTLVTVTFTNTSWAFASNADECWTDWVSYWSMHPPSPAVWTAITKNSSATTTSYTETLTLGGSDVTEQTVTSTITSTAPTIADNGGFTTTMPVVVVTYTTVLTSFFSATSLSTLSNTYTLTQESLEYTTIGPSNDPDWPPPSCTLPAVYPACQSQWDEYATHNAAPFPPPLSAK
jgi:hypothetical protein